MASYLTESSRWVALEAHDPLADGNFVYCVKTTGIYCRPTCGARLARRANVVFQDDASAAQEAGFRACKRCKPDLDKDDSQATLVARARHTIEKTQAETGSIPSIADLAEAAGLTKSHFHRIFKKITGVTPRVYAQGLRTRIEIRVNRIPTGLRKAKMGDLLLKYNEAKSNSSNAILPGMTARGANIGSPSRNLLQENQRNARNSPSPMRQLSPKLSSTLGD
ncbi:hypothetical protein V502_00974 [Pseudogymnoascus sp. VKM F-4520 (FW-2644)]|nr:hypothetical protein V502_00974 [Pseudogymnoascus sp. VKM F-4520 (FW-2644)]